MTDTDTTTRPETANTPSLLDELLATFGFPMIVAAALDNYDALTAELALFTYYADAYDGTIPRIFGPRTLPATTPG